MNEKRCKNCNAILHDDENYCLFCGTKQEEITPIIQTVEDDTKIKKPTHNPKFLRIVFFVVLGIIALFLQSNLFNIIAIIISLKLYNDQNKNNLKNTQTKATFTQKALTIGVVILFFVFGLIGVNMFNIDNTVEEIPEEYTYEIEPGYEYIEPITVDDMTKRLEVQIRKVTDSFEYLTLDEFDDQFIVNFDITNVSDRKEAIRVFKQIVSNLRFSEMNYPYIKDLNVHYYSNGEYLYSARFYNLFLKGMNSIETDGVFYDYQSNVSVLFETLDEGFEFPETTIDYDQPLPASAEKYLVDYEEWYGDFDVISNEIYDAFDEISNRFIEDGIIPTQDEIKNLDYLTRQFNYRCTTFDQIETDTYYEVFHQYFSRACQYYVRAYKNNLDGLMHKSIDRIEYSYLDYNIAYDYFNQIFESEEEVVGSDA